MYLSVPLGATFGEMGKFSLSWTNTDQNKIFQEISV